jgi:hypothetical protein
MTTQDKRVQRNVQEIDAIISKYASMIIYSHSSIKDEDFQTKDAIAEQGSGMFTELPEMKSMIHDWATESNGKLPIDKYIDWPSVSKLFYEFLDEML